MLAYSVNSVNKNLLTLRPFRPMPMVESDISLMRLCILVLVLLTCIEPGGCEFETCCVKTIGDAIATEARSETQEQVCDVCLLRRYHALHCWGLFGTPAGR